MPSTNEQALMRAVGIDPSGNPARQSTGSELPLDVGTMKKLLATGLKPDACRDRAGTTALGVAAFLGRPEAMKVLLEYGADIEAENLDGASPLSMAVFGRSADALAMCLVYGAEDLHEDVIAEARGTASSMGAHECLEVFDAWDDGEETPEIQAAEARHAESEKIMKKNAEVEEAIDWKARCLIAETKLARAEEKLADAEERIAAAEERAKKAEDGGHSAKHAAAAAHHNHLPKMLQFFVGGHHGGQSERDSHRTTAGSASSTPRGAGRSESPPPKKKDRKHSLLGGRWSLGTHHNKPTAGAHKSMANLLVNNLKRASVGGSASALKRAPSPEQANGSKPGPPPPMVHRKSHTVADGLGVSFEPERSTGFDV